MKLFRCLLPLLAGCALSANTLSAQAFAGIEGDLISQDQERDTQAVEEFLANKRAILVEDKGGCLSISGDVRFEWQYKHEKHNGLKIRGDGSEAQMDGNRRWFGSHEFDVEVNLYFDYTTECTWAKIQLDYDNDAGAIKCCNAIANTKANSIAPEYTGEDDICESGTCNKFCVEQAYFGFNILEDGCCRLDIEVGRRRLYHVFESRLQFNNRFDGILGKYSNCYECVGDFYVYGGWFIVDEVVNHFGYVAEFGVLDLMDCGLDLRYSFIHWKHDGDHRSAASADFCEDKYRYQNSQLSFAYHLDCECICLDTTIYGGIIYNHAARKKDYTNNKKKNIAWYLGASVGDVYCEGDWSIDVNYQWVEAQAIPDCDNSGIGRGNAPKACFVSDTAFGNGNYHGFLVEGAYALTDNITLVSEFEWSKELDDNIGGIHKFYKFELELIYAF